MDSLPDILNTIDPCTENSIECLGDVGESQSPEFEGKCSNNELHKLSKIRIIFIDIDGTLIHDVDRTVIPNAINAIERLRGAGFFIRYVTNIIKGSINDLLSHMRKLGFSIEYEEIFTSLCATRIHLDKNELRPFLVVDDSVKSFFKGVNTEDPNCIVLGLPSSQFDYCILPKLRKMLLRGAPLITYNMAENEATDMKGVYRMGLGPFIQCLEFISNTKAIVNSKPSPEFFNYALQQSGFKVEECVMIGDDICEDIAGSINAGIYGILVQTGQYKVGDEEKFKPGLMVDNINTAVDHLISTRKTIVNELVHQANSTDNQLQLEAMITIRKLLSHENSPIASLINNGILATLKNVLSNTTANPDLQYEAEWILINIAAGSSAQTFVIVEAGICPLLVPLMSSTDKMVAEEAVWAIGNIIADGPEMRDYMVGLGVVDPLLNLMKQEDISSNCLQQMVSVVSNILRPQNFSTFPQQMLPDILSALTNVLVHPSKDIRVLSNMLRAFTFFTNEGNEEIQMLIDGGVLPELVSLLSHEEPNIRLAALKVMQNIVAGTYEQAQEVLDCGALSHFISLLSDDKEKICLEALKFLSNVAAGNESQIQDLIDAQLIPLISDHLLGGKFLFTTTQKEAAWAIGNITDGGNIDQIKYLLSCDVIPRFCRILSQSKEQETIKVVLTSIYNILEIIAGSEDEKLVCNAIVEYGGFHKLKLMRRHNSDIVIKEDASAILNTFFEGVDKELHHMDYISGKFEQEAQLSSSSDG